MDQGVWYLVCLRVLSRTKKTNDRITVYRVELEVAVDKSAFNCDSHLLCKPTASAISTSASKFYAVRQDSSGIKVDANPSGSFFADATLKLTAGPVDGTKQWLVGRMTGLVQSFLCEIGKP